MRFAAPKSRRDEALAQIERHIATRGQHVHLVHPTSLPGWGHTIGLRASLGFELILAGAVYFAPDEVMQILSDVARQLRSGSTGPFGVTELSSCSRCTFSVRQCDPSWSDQLLERGREYYRADTLSARQLFPDEQRWTVDTPDLSEPFDPARATAWRWLQETWDLPVPEDSQVVTSLSVLQGAPVTRATRHDEDHWEAFGREPTSDADVRLVPIGVLLAADPRMEALLTMAPDTSLEWE